MLTAQAPAFSLCRAREVLPQWQFAFLDMPRNIGVPDPQHPTWLLKDLRVPDEEMEVQILEY